MTRSPLGAIARACLLIAGMLIAAIVTAAPAHADVSICEKYGSTTIQSGRYVVQNNNWGDDTTQCVNVTSTGFSITTASHNKPTNGAPGSYPSVFFGCHYANCSSGSGLPMQASNAAFNNLNTSVSMTLSGSGVWDAAYDIWFDPTPRTDGQNTGAEIMVWLNKLGSIQPVGSQVGTVTLAGATWNVWYGNIGWNVISYVRQSGVSSIDFNVNTIYSDAINRGYAQRSWYLTSIQAGFEPWVGQTGLAVNSFSVTTSSGGDTSPPTTPGTLSASGVTSSGANLSWGASSDNVGVTGYDVFRASGASGGTFTQVGTASGTTFAATGLSASSTYRFYVRARDAAGNASGNSGTVTVTTTSGGGGSSCRVGYVPNTWSNGFTATVTITNTGGTAINGWTLTFSFSGNQQITNGWQATVTQSGQSVTARDAGYNAVINPNGGTGSFGFQGTYSGTNASPTAFSLNGTACTV